MSELTSAFGRSGRTYSVRSGASGEWWVYEDFLAESACIGMIILVRDGFRSECFWANGSTTDPDFDDAVESLLVNAGADPRSEIWFRPSAEERRSPQQKLREPQEPLDGSGSVAQLGHQTR